MATLIHADGRTETIVPAAGKKITLDQAQRAVGGYVEMLRCVYDGKPRHMLVDEEGKRKGLPRNTTATAAFLAAGRRMPFDHVVGPALIVEPGEGWK